MRVRLFTLGFNPATDAFDDSAVHEFLAEKNACSIGQHVFVKEDAPTSVVPAGTAGTQYQGR